MSAGQDYTRTIKPAGVERINANGETFLFVKFADRDIDVDIGGRKVVMRAGSYQEFEPLSAQNSAITLYNKDPENPAFVELVTGTGTYDEKIIKGEIVIDPRVKTGDGRYVSDTRAMHNVLVTMDYKREPVINAGDGEFIMEIPESEFGALNAGNGATFDDESIYVYWQGNPNRAITLNRETGKITESYDINESNRSYKSGLYLYNGTWALAGTDGFIYRYTEGNTDPISESEKMFDFKAPVQWFKKLFYAENGDIWGIDNEDTFCNISQEYIAFYLPGLSGNKTPVGATFINGELFYANTTPELVVYRQTGPQSWELDRTIATAFFFGSFTFGIEYEQKTGLINTFEANTFESVYKVGEVEPISYNAGELHYGYAQEACSRVPALYNPAILHDKRTDAPVTVEWESGKAFVTGAVIEYILTLLGIDASGNYLDGITGFQATAKNREININLGGRTFAADKIPDDFQAVELPQVVTITALNSLWSN